ncbi:hypothetical protein ACFPRE_15135 [Variovorax soli]|uniref:hypothetical protein n=1 Tax=Variovorax soli TaxID=376815 RepID=UPI00361EF3A9
MQILASFFIAASLLAGLPAWAQAPASAPAAAAEAARCDGVQQDKAACQREAGAARQEAARGGLTSGGLSGNQANALARCQQLPAADRADCEARVRGGEGSSSSGSVMGGGVIRETVTPVPAPAEAAPPAK